MPTDAPFASLLVIQSNPPMLSDSDITLHVADKSSGLTVS
jgi:hypothetical protein